jgi:hypothetical protein
VCVYCLAILCLCFVGVSVWVVRVFVELCFLCWVFVCLNYCKECLSVVDFADLLAFLQVLGEDENGPSDPPSSPSSPKMGHLTLQTGCH